LARREELELEQEEEQEEEEEEEEEARKRRWCTRRSMRCRRSGWW
jgi:hypothetical protein